MGFDARLPLIRDPSFGWALTRTVREEVRQDFMILLLTTPGERVMDPEFGVGLKRYLFEQLTRTTLGNLENRIRQQTSKYLSFIKIENIQFTSALDSIDNATLTDFDENTVAIKISYSFGRGTRDEIIVSP
tara:strand:- start:442 stop:834 length:393 start_codon:yes stop_codon:yes gene_type:complete